MNMIVANTSTREESKAKFLAEMSRVFDRVWARAEEPDEDVASDLEHLTGAGAMPVLASLVGVGLGRACEVATERELAQMGLTRAQVRVRLDRGYIATLSTTFGRTAFPWFAFRRPIVGTGTNRRTKFVTENPARRLLPYYDRCRSSPMCIEWESRLGSRDAFRKAQELMRFATREALDLEDTTIERHMIAASKLVDPSWLYLKPEDIRRTMTERATRDLKTGRPLLYASSDAHALRRYVGETWAWSWKMVNGIRLWCEDKESGQIIHLGGEFTWGDCRAVAERFRSLIRSGILPNDTAEWGAVDTCVVFISDGEEWLTDHVLPLLPGAVVIIDPYHAVGWFAALGTVVFGSGTKKAQALHAAAWAAIFGERDRRGKGGDKKRRGQKRGPRGQRVAHAHDRYRAQVRNLRHRSADAITKGLLDLLATIKASTPQHTDEIEKLATRLANNAFRLKYSSYLERGMQVGSGPMESLHRTGSQQRLKRSARWLEESSEAVLKLRLLEISGRWAEFWHQRNLPRRLAEAFETMAAAEALARAEAARQMCDTDTAQPTKRPQGEPTELAA